MHLCQILQKSKQKKYCREFPRFYLQVLNLQVKFYSRVAFYYWYFQYYRYFKLRLTSVTYVII